MCKFNAGLANLCWDLEWNYYLIMLIYPDVNLIVFNVCYTE